MHLTHDNTAMPHFYMDNSWSLRKIDNGGTPVDGDSCKLFFLDSWEGDMSVTGATIAVQLISLAHEILSVHR